VFQEGGARGAMKIDNNAENQGWWFWKKEAQNSHQFEVKITEMKNLWIKNEEQVVD